MSAAPDPDAPASPVYLGDGVYLVDDGFQIGLALGDHRHDVAVWLEPGVAEALVRQLRRIFWPKRLAEILRAEADRLDPPSQS